MRSRSLRPSRPFRSCLLRKLTNPRTALADVRYWLFGVIPLLSPIRAIPPVAGMLANFQPELTADYFKSRNRTPFNSYEAISVSL